MKVVSEELMMEHLLTADEVAKILNVPRKTVLNLSRSGAFPRLKIGGKTVRFHPSDIAEYVRKARHVDGVGGWNSG